MKEDLLIPSNIKNVLIRGTNWVGDTIISLPAAREIRRIMSGARMTFWIPENLGPLVRRAGVCDDIVAVPPGQRSPITRSFRAATMLANHSFDLVVLLQNAFESAFTSWLARVPVRLGYPTDLRGPFLNIKVPFPNDIKNKHQAYYYMGIADFIRSIWSANAPETTEILDFVIPFHQEDAQKALELVDSLGGRADAPWFCLCPGSSNSEAKRWPSDYFARLADMIQEKLQGQVIFCGAPSESSLIEKIISTQKNSGAINLSGKTDMLGMMCVMSLATLVVSNDTGSAHLGAAAGATVLTLFGPTSAGATAPLGTKSHTLRGVAPCAPCRYYKCPKADHPCMRNLTPKMVFDKIESLS